jgi:hypothetical protein
MRFIIGYIAGVVFGLPLVWFLTRKLGASEAAGLGSRFMRMGLRCLALSLAFAPTGVVAGYVAFPFPASAMLATWLLAPAQDRHNFAQSTEWGIGSLIVCWLVFMTIYIVVAWLIITHIPLTRPVLTSVACHKEVTFQTAKKRLKYPNIIFNALATPRRP